MITLKTLPQATEQEVFDQIATHLLNQNERSRDEYHLCLYRDDEGLKCAAGCLIGDDEYDEQFEHNGWRTLVCEELVPEKHSKLIQDFQSVHDTLTPDKWVDGLTTLAKKLRLSTRVIDEFLAS